MVGDEQGECRFTHARRSPQDHGVQVARLDGMAQSGSVTHQVFLPDIFVNAFGA